MYALRGWPQYGLAQHDHPFRQKAEPKNSVPLLRQFNLSSLLISGFELRQLPIRGRVTRYSRRLHMPHIVAIASATGSCWP